VVLLIVNAIVCGESKVDRRGSVGRDELKVERRRTVEERRVLYSIESSKIISDEE
jgi:hypothetical protein